MSRHRSLPLFPETTDDVHRETLRARGTRGDREFDDAKRRKSMRKQWKAPAVPVDGPACQRCSSWRQPEEGHTFGACRMLGVLEDRVPHRSLEKGTVMATQDAHALRLPISSLRTAAWAACSLFGLVDEVAA